jgi:leucine efflux protein
MAYIDWISFVIASIAVVLTPGPGSLFVARTAVVSGLKAGYAAMLGIMVGDTCLIMLSTLGVSALFATYPAVFDLFRLAGAGYLVFLGLRLVFKRPRTRSFQVPNRDRSFMQALSITLLNPKAVFFFMAFFPIFIRSPEHGRFLAYAVMAVAFQVISGAYLSTLVRTSSWTASTLQRNNAARIVLEKLCGCAFIGFGMKVALSKR